MPNWTQEQHANARAWCQGGGAKGRALAGALDEIERLQAENAQLLKYCDHHDDCPQFGVSRLTCTVHELLEPDPCWCGWAEKYDEIKERTDA